MDHVESQFLQQAIGRFKLLLSLSREADDDVRRQAHTGHRRRARFALRAVEGLAYTSHQVAVLGHAVAAAHAPQDQVVARLDRHLHVLADLGQSGHRLDEAVCHVRWMGGEEPDALQPCHFMHRLEEVGQVGSPAAPICLAVGIGQIVAIGVHVLAQERRLFGPSGRQVANLGEDFVYRAADLLTAPQADDAVGAQVVAAIGDGHPGRNGHPLRGKGLRPLPGRAAGEIPGQVDHGVDVRGQDKGVDPGIALLERRYLVDIAAHEDDLQLGLATLQTLQGSEPARDLVLGALPHDTGVEYDQIGLTGPVDLAVAHRFQCFGSPA